MLANCMRRLNDRLARKCVRRLLALTVTLMLTVQPALGQIPCRYEYITWPNMDCGFGPYPGGPVAINVHGHVCLGWSSCGEPVDMTAIWYGSGNPVILPIPQGYRAMKPEDMNDLGEIVGRLELPMGTPNPIRAFLRRTNGQVFDLGLPAGATRAEATAINNHSEIVGFAGTPNGNRAFLWRNGRFTYLDLPIGPHSQALDINDASQITGFMGDSHWNSRAFIWQEGQTIIIGPVGASNSAIGMSISAGGRVAGYAMSQTGKYTVRRDAFVWGGGVLTEIPNLPGYTQGWAASSNNSIVLGRAEEGNDDPTIFIWSDGQIRRLSDLVPVSNLWFYEPGAVEADGRIAIAGRVGSTWQGFLLMPVYAPGDCTGDCFVNVNDLLLVINEWGKAKSPADVNRDGIVNVFDIHVVIENWTHN